MATPSSLPPLILTALILIVIVSFFLISQRRRRRYENLEQEQEQEEEEEVQEREQEQEQNAAASPTVAAIGGVEEKRRKKRGKKKKKKKTEEISGSFCLFPCPGASPAAEGSRAGAAAGRADCPFPFSSFASATQRKIKVQYDELVKSNQAKALTMAQVGQFVNCLVEERNALQHISEIIKRSFKIKKALLFKADRSSFDRLSQQIYKLEAEHKRLEEDATVYNLLQEQLKLSPAYKTMLEVGASMELKGPSQEQAMEFSDISFEELLAQEMKDSFWQRNGKLRSCTS